MRKLLVALAVLLLLSVSAAPKKETVTTGKCHFIVIFNLVVKRDVAGQIESVDLKDGVTDFKACPGMSELIDQIDQEQFAIQQADDNK